MNKTKGLTLLELIIASAIFTVIMAVLYTSFSSGIFGTKSIDDSIKVTGGARLILGKLNSDLINSFVFSDEEARFSGREDELSFMTLTDSFIEGTFFREYSKVSYTQDQERLLRVCRRNKQSLDPNSEVTPQELSAGAQIKFEYGYYSIPDERIIFKDSWATEGTEALLEEEKNPPLAVKVNLTLGSSDAESFERTIYIPYTQLVR